MNVVPELTEPGEPQGLVGDPACAVIDHENKSAGQQQQPHKSKKTADHASPYIGRARRRSQPLPGPQRKFNLISTLSLLSKRAPGLSQGPESVDAAIGGLYKGGNGGGRNPAAAVL
jgi:hypothetical protein